MGSVTHRLFLSEFISINQTLNPESRTSEKLDPQQTNNLKINQTPVFSPVLRTVLFPDVFYYFNSVFSGFL